MAYRSSPNSESFLDRAEVRVTDFFGSRLYIGFLAAFILFWILANAGFIAHHFESGGWDPYPFILLNLVFSMISIFQQPMILLTAKRAERRASIQEAEALRQTHEYRNHMRHAMQAMVSTAEMQTEIYRKVESIGDGMAVLVEQMDTDNVRYHAKHDGES